MTKLLRTYLEMAMNPESSIVKSLAATIPKNIGYNHDGKLMRVKELLLSEAIESTTLIQAEAHATVMEGSEPSICLRAALSVIGMKSRTMNWTVGETGTYAPEVAEATDIPIDNQDYDTVEFVAKKYGVRPLITRELIEDGLFNVAELEMKKAGRRVENRLNQNGITELIDSAGLEHDTAGTNQGIKAIAAAVSQVRGAGFNPDTLIMHPEAEAIVLQEFVPTNYYPTEAIVNTGMVPNILGLKTHTCGVVDNGTQEWGYAAGGEIGMVVYDSVAAAAIGMRRDITVENYDDPIKDMVGMTVTSRFDVESIIPNACSRVEY
ncbi:phage major capsid protein [Candidatus Pacearchaeota archaeon]|nr:phage major capsid protein [Candidatus Pacearchaeota archaeon]